MSNLVKLYSDPNSTAMVGFDYELKVPVVIKYFQNGVAAAVTLPAETLTITYHPDPNVQREYQQTDAFRFANGCQVEVTVQTSGITGKRLNGTALTPAEMERVAKTVFLQSEIAVERYYNFNLTTMLCPADITLTPQAADNSLEVKWRATISPNVPLGAEEWDVEWLYVDDYDYNFTSNTVVYKPAALLNYNFNQNAARAQVKGDSYRIPLVYEHGYLLVRVRPVGRVATDNFTTPMPGRWSCGFTSCAATCNSSTGIVGNYVNRYFNNVAHEKDLKNWQAVTTYAEDGKRKDVVSYYDGSMRNRQSITGLSTEKLTLVGETIYDYQGRGALTVLPAPVNDATLRYYGNFNQYSATQPYNREHFDKNDPACANPAQKMLPNNSGASRYYSAFNPDKSGFNALIPDADGYPFTRTEYTPDNTGRIARQGGVGSQHQLGSDHETKYFYGVPHQEELDQLFGSEAGNTLRYKKNMVMDPNGQISLTYQDAKGNTIATALAGNAPTNVLPIPSYATAQVTFTVDLLAHNQTDLDRYALVMQQTELVTTESDYVFNYEYRPEKLEGKDCEGVDFCLDCIYDLEFRIVDNLNCGNVLYQKSHALGNLFTTNPKPSISTICEQSFTWTALPTFSVRLKPGSYTISKTLTVNESAADAYVAAVLDTCPTLYNQILQSQYAEMDTSGCEVDCADAMADKNNAAYYASLTPAEQQELTDLVSDLCDSLQVSSCAAAYAAMLEDVSPGGQYGYTGTTDIGEMLVSVYWPSNTWTTNDGLVAHYLNPGITFLDANGAVVPKTPIEDFIQSWRPEWATQLVQYHPEYCYYQFCAAYMEPSDLYNAKLMNTETYVDAAAAGYLTGSPIGIWQQDPLCVPANTNLNALYANYSTLILGNVGNYKGSGKSMEELALAAAAYPSLSPPLTWAAATPTVRERAWPIFRGLYLTYKEEVSYQLRSKYAIQNNCYNECLGDSEFNPFLNGFFASNGFWGTAFTANTSQKNCDVRAYHLFKNKMKRFPSIYDILPDDFPFDFFATPQKPVFDYLINLWGDQKQQVCCDSLFAELPQFLFALYSSGQSTFTLNAAASNNFPNNIELALLNGATQATGSFTLSQATGVYSVFSGEQVPCRQLQFKFLTPVTGTVTSFCCYKEIPNGTAFPGIGVHFQMTATIAGGKTVVIEGIFSRDCPFECPTKPTPCADQPVKDELLVLFNYLIYQQKLRAGSVLVPDWVAGPNLAATFGGTGNFTWNAAAGTSTAFTATLSRGAKTCTFNLTQPPSFNWAQVSQALSLQPNLSQQDLNGNVRAFTVPLKMTNGGTQFMPGSSPCFVVSKCCAVVSKDKPCNACPTIAQMPLEPGTILAQISPTKCDPPCEPEEGYTRPISNPCVEQMIAIAQHNAQEMYEDKMLELRTALKADYMKKCLEAAEKFSETYTDARHHFTLYYYDQANNLVETVPPAGVAPLTAAQQTQVKVYRQTGGGSPVYGAHTLVSRYRYNSLNQLTWQLIPDHTAAAQFWYDPLSRLIASQNAKQAPNTQYSYTKYDALGRIAEVGQIKRNTAPPVVNAAFSTNWANWLNTNDRDQITNTWYDRVALSTAPALFPNSQQENLRGRVASISYNGVPPGGFITLTNWIHYSYDIHGNVKTLVQDNLGLGPKTVEYEYDLVSGNVNTLAYQRNQPDQFLHRYAYDADNRLTEVRTSIDGVLWDKEAAYKYYKHGPLARAELGNDRVQGLDFAYTLHGWIKGMNSGALQPQHDMGKDGQNILPGHFARDAVGYLLGYFNGEYKPIGGTAVTFEPGYTGTNLDAPAIAPSLFNGNIRHMVTAIKPLMPGQIPLATMYRYDQLNRLRNTVADSLNFDLSNNKWLAGTADKRWGNTYTYDPNGNILALNRNGNKTGAQLIMDKQIFNYQTGTNKLIRVDDDPLLSANYTEDIDHQSGTLVNYTYDNIGNLIKDNAEKLSYTWNLQGKVTQIDDADAPAKTIQFVYDPLGNRYAKGIQNQSGTFYAHDASGNVLATYQASASGMVWQSAMLYGSKRLGEYRADKCLGSGCLPPPTLVGHYYRFRGKRRYEEGNHLGNVLATVSDRKLPTAGTATVSNFYYEDFAVGIAGWIPNNNGILTNSNGKLKISGAAANDGGQVKLPVFPGQTYTLNFDLGYGTSAGALFVTLVQKVGNTYQNTPLAFSQGANTYSFTAASETYLNIRLSTSGSKFFLLDNLALTTGGLAAGTVAGHFEADALSAQDYYPFGMGMPGRELASGGMRYGFNGMQKDDEVKGAGNSYDMGARPFDPRVGRAQKPDPAAGLFPGDSPYMFAGNNPIYYIDEEGKWKVKWKNNNDHSAGIVLEAEPGDNLQTLADQMGIPYKELVDQNFAGKDFTLDAPLAGGEWLRQEDLPGVKAFQNINNYLAKEDLLETNCANCAMNANGIETPNAWLDENGEYDPEGGGGSGKVMELVENTIISEFEGVSAERAKIGDVITYQVELMKDQELLGWGYNTYGKDKNFTFTQDGNYSQAYLNLLQSQKTNVDHYSVVLLKTKDGKEIQQVFEKLGRGEATFSNYNNGKSGDFNAKPVKGGASAIHSKE